MTSRLLLSVTEDDTTVLYGSRLCNHCLPCNMLIRKMNQMAEKGKKIVTTINYFFVPLTW